MRHSRIAYLSPVSFPARSRRKNCGVRFTDSIETRRTPFALCRFSRGLVFTSFPFRRRNVEPSFHSSFVHSRGRSHENGLRRKGNLNSSGLDALHDPEENCFLDLKELVP